MATICSAEIDILNTDNVMNSQNSATFQRPLTLVQSCLQTPDPFSTFCLYPPDEGRMVVMCDNPRHADSGFLFTRMLANEFTDTSQLPRVISYPDLHSTDDWTPTSIPVNSVFANLATNPPTDFATSNDTKVSAAIINGKWYMSDLDGLLRPIPGFVVSQINVFSAVNISSDGNIRIALFPSHGVYLWTTVLNNFIQFPIVVPSETIIGFTSVLLWENNSNLSIGVVYVAVCFFTNLASYVFLYLLNANLQGVLSTYKQVRVPFASIADKMAWCLLMPNADQIFFGITSSAASYQYGFISTATSSSLGLTNIATIAISNFSSVTVQALRKWYGIVSSSAPSSGTALLLNSNNERLVINFPAGVIFTSSLLPFTGVHRLAQRGSVSAYFNSLTNQFQVNGVLQAPPFALSQDDVLAITLDNQFVVVNAVADGGAFHRFDIPTLHWETADGTNNLFLGDLSPALNELVLGHTEWFLGTTFASNPVIPPLISFPVDILISRHSIVKLTAISVSSQTGTVQTIIYEANVPQIFRGSGRVVQFYDSGNIRVYNNADDALNNLNIVWESFTDDMEGSEISFAVLPDVNSPPQAKGVSRAVSSPNGRYLLLVFLDRVDIVFNPFNAPRFTSSTSIVQGALQHAVNAQATFCVQALNGELRNSLNFVDKRCACLTSQRLLQRVYPKIGKLDIPTQQKLAQDFPCVMKDCQLDDTEYSNAGTFVGTRCIAPTGVCSEHIDPSIANMVLVQDCSVNLNPCVTSATCPVGSNCRNGQCVAQCSSDATCRNANPLARCIGGQCQELTPNQAASQSSTRLSTFWIVCIGLALVLFLFLVLLVFFSTKRS